MSLRAVIFDYGMVLTGQPSAEAHDAMLRITGLPHDEFEKIYWADRHAYDEGKLTGLQFWQNIVRDAKLNLDARAIDELNLWDARMWTTQNPAMLAWQHQLKERGIRTAILSNMGDTVLANIERTRLSTGWRLNSWALLPKKRFSSTTNSPTLMQPMRLDWWGSFSAQWSTFANRSLWRVWIENCRFLLKQDRDGLIPQLFFGHLRRFQAMRGDAASGCAIAEPCKC